jgi:hypothetical protein
VLLFILRPIVQKRDKERGVKKEDLKWIGDSGPIAKGEKYASAIGVYLFLQGLFLFIAAIFAEPHMTFFLIGLPFFVVGNIVLWVNGMYRIARRI